MLLQPHPVVAVSHITEFKPTPPFAAAAMVESITAEALSGMAGM
jgi:hypothetical protein